MGEVDTLVNVSRRPLKLARTTTFEEIAHLIAAAANLKHQTTLLLDLGKGLCSREVILLKIGDIARWPPMTQRVEQGKGVNHR